MKHRILFIISILWILLLTISVPGSPAFGSFFNYSSGFLQILSPEKKQMNEIVLNNDQYNGEVYIDSVGIPHIFAKDIVSSSYFLGYMHARDRMFQMELIVRMVQGKLSEVVGEKALKSDLYWKNYDFDKKYEHFLYSKLNKNSELFKRLVSYSDGVKEYISTMEYSDIPEEYFLLDFRPMEWKPHYSFLLIKYMSNMLSSRRFDTHFQSLIEVLPKEVIKQFYPLQEKYLQTTIPEKTGTFDPNSIEESWEKMYGEKITSLSKEDRIELGNKDILGSNNWVVSAKKSSSGKAILANDMHLRLSLPSPWYEAHIKTNDRHLYGLTIPCAPMIIAGHNEAIAWGETNVTWDLTDFYEIVYSDDKKHRYYKGEQIKNVQFVKDTILIRDRDAHIYTKKITDFGPIVEIEGKEFAYSWIADKITNDAIAFVKLEKATTYSGFEDAFSHYRTPPQNFVYADTSGNIGYHASGLMWKKAEGKERGIFKSTDTEIDVNMHIKFENTPNIYNPEKGFIATANQRQLHNHEDYYNWRFSAPYRGYRISEMLRENEEVSVSDMRDIQADVTDRTASQLLPILFEIYSKENKYSEEINLLKEWDHRMNLNSKAAPLYDSFRDSLFTSLSKFIQGNISGLQNPTDWVIAYNLMENEVIYANGMSIRRDELFRSAFKSSIQAMKNEFGDINNWAYGKYHQTSMQHLLRLKGFSEPTFPSEGSAFTPNVAKYRITTHGASQRSIIHMTTPIESYFNIAGGQSGRPSSKHFNDQISDWRKVTHRKSQFVNKASELKNIQFKITIRGN